MSLNIKSEIWWGYLKYFHYKKNWDQFFISLHAMPPTLHKNWKNTLWKTSFFVKWENVMKNLHEIIKTFFKLLHSIVEKNWILTFSLPWIWVQVIFLFDDKMWENLQQKKSAIWGGFLCNKWLLSQYLLIQSQQ